MSRKMVRTSVRDGYDLWAKTYDETPNHLISMDRRYTLRLLNPARRERILDAGCGTGRNLGPMHQLGARPTGLDFSINMLRVAHTSVPFARLVQADLQAPLPFRRVQFDAVLCALIGEHLEDLGFVFREFRRALRPTGRFVFSVYHPDLVQAGKEANFAQNETEYRLGAIRWSVDDYLQHFNDSGFSSVSYQEWAGDEELARSIPNTALLMRRKILLTISASLA